MPQAVEKRYNKVTHLPPYKASSRARELQPQLTIVDLHADSLLWGRDLLKRSDVGHVDLPRLRDANVAIQFFTVVTKTPKHLNIEHNRSNSDSITELVMAEGWPPRTWKSLLQRAIYQADRLNAMAASSGGKLRVIHSSAELDRFLAERSQDRSLTATVLGLEGAHALEGNISNLDRLYDAGFRLAAPTHFFDNDLAGSSAGMEQAGLTPKGRDFVRAMEQRHMIIDLAHASSATIADVTAMARQPVIISHTGVRGTCNNQRNLSDDELRRIASTGGVVGIGYWKTAVCGDGAVAIAGAIRHAAQTM
jgi:microsomal dipeptidase-like Zn-dependent dipeptidase